MRNSILVRSIAAVSGIVMLASVAACGDNTASNTDSSASTDTKTTEAVSGNFSGAGASSQQAAVEAWIAGFQGTNPDAKVAYNPSGSGAGVSTFLTGATAWAGSDAALSNDEVEQSKSVCASGNAFDIPVYVSPIAVVFNLNGISGKGKTLNMDADTIAKIFDGKITKWNDDAIKQQNPKVDLPDLDITVVHRSDKSGTTKNFLSYVKDAAGDAWSYELGENWPNEVGQGAKGTSGVISTVQQADGTIGYADASQAGELGTVAVKVGDDYVPFSAEAAAKVVDAPRSTNPPLATTAWSSSSTTTPPRLALPDRACLLRHRLPGIQGCRHRQVRQVLAHLRGQRRRSADRCLRSRLRSAVRHHASEGPQVHRRHRNQVSFDTVSDRLSVNGN